MDQCFPASEGSSNSQTQGKVTHDASQGSEY